MTNLRPLLAKPPIKIGPLMSGTEWIHDGVAIYYSHASIQLGWVLGRGRAHGKNVDQSQPPDEPPGIVASGPPTPGRTCCAIRGFNTIFLGYADLSWQNGVAGQITKF